MPDLESTRVFGASTTRVVGLRRRPLADLYHVLVAGSWGRLLFVYASVYFLAQALFGLAHLLLAAGPIGGPFLPALVAAIASPAAPAAPLTPAWFAGTALSGMEGFFRWLMVGIGAGIIFGKFSLLRARILWSRNAIVGPYGRGTALMFRMANERSSHIVQAKVNALLIWNEPDEDGYVTRRAHDLELARGGTALFTHAWTAAHRIEGRSPLVGADDAILAAREAEVVVTLTGYDEELTKLIHARQTYPAAGILWGVRFREVVRTLPSGARLIDYRRFHDTADADEAEVLPDHPRVPRAGR
jgi:inward rectifier potassium channel